MPMHYFKCKKAINNIIMYVLKIYDIVFSFRSNALFEIDLQCLFMCLPSIYKIEYIIMYILNLNVCIIIQLYLESNHYTFYVLLTLLTYTHKNTHAHTHI